MLRGLQTSLERRNRKECSKVLSVENAFWKNESEESANNTVKTVLLEIIIDIFKKRI